MSTITQDIKKYQQKAFDCRKRSQDMVAGSVDFKANLVMGRLYTRIVKDMKEIKDLTDDKFEAC